MQVFNIFIIIQIFYIQSLYASITNPNGIFKGVIIISFTDEPSVKGLKNYLSHQAFRAAYTNGIIDEKKWRSEYSLRLSQSEYYYINRDTLISVRINMIGDTLSSYIQIRNNNYFKSDFGDGYSKMNIPYGVEGVTNWKSVISKTLGNNNLKQYNGNDNQMSYDLMVDHAYNYEEQSELGFNFKNIFFKGGIIRTRKEVYPPSQLNRTHEVIDISHQPINCADIMRDLSFDPDENAKPISVNSIFYIYDTVLTETALRPHPSLSIHTSDTDSISIDQLPGKYKYVTFILDKFNNSIQLNNQLEDLSQTYQNKGIQFYTVVLSDNQLEPIKVKLFSKRNNEPIYYLKKGRSHAIFKQSTQLPYPISFLFDAEGKIILVNAPPPSNPILRDVLGRLE